MPTGACDEPAIAIDGRRTETRAAAGTGRLVISRGTRHSVVTRAFATSPLKWLTPAFDAPAAWIFSSSYGGGLVDGDAIDIDVTVEAHARAMLSTQASTKVYRAAVGAASHLSARIEDHGVLVNLPDPVVCFAQARYRQVQTFHLGEHANLVSLDWMTSGRFAYGERWDFEAYDSRTTVTVADRLLVNDALRLHQSDGRLSARMGRFDVMALVILVGPLLGTAVAETITSIASRAPARRPDLIASAAPIANGCIVRLAGMRVADVRSALRDLLAFVPALVGDDPWERKW